MFSHYYQYAYKREYEAPMKGKAYYDLARQVIM